MKKFVLLLISLLIAVNCAMAKEKIFDIYNDKKTQASKILYDTVLREEKWTKKDAAEKFNVDLESSSAFFIDLNDDGINEIIGVIWSSFFYCKQGWQIFILHKENGQYKNIAEILHFEPQDKIRILDNKTSGFRNILTYSIDLRHIPWSDAPYTPTIFKYENGKYVYEFKGIKDLDYQCPVP